MSRRLWRGVHCCREAVVICGDYGSGPLVLLARCEPGFGGSDVAGFFALVLWTIVHVSVSPPLPNPLCNRLRNRHPSRR